MDCSYGSVCNLVDGCIFYLLAIVMQKLCVCLTSKRKSKQASLSYINFNIRYEPKM